MKVCLIVGTRPQFVKAAALHPVLVARGHATTLVDTGQHVAPAMAGDLRVELGLPEPDHQLGVGGPLRTAATTGLDDGARDDQIRRMIAGIDCILRDDRPDWVLVFGDTNSTVAGARAAHAHRLPLAHVEAGLRSFNRDMPEERNRVETDRLAWLLFCPSERARQQLAAEGRRDGVHVVGDVMIDALERIRAQPAADTLARIGVAAQAYVVATVHRQATTDDGETLRRVFATLAEWPLTVVCPVHPRTAARLAELGGAPAGALRLVAPLGRRDLVTLMASARAVITDSGGVQKEAYWLGVPCLTLRDETEWTETVEAGWNHLVGTDPERLRAAWATLTTPAARPPLYGAPGGAGGAARRIVDLLERGAGRP